VADDEYGVVAGVVAGTEDAADRCVVAGEELVAGLATGHPPVEVALDPGGHGVDVAGDRVMVLAHLEVAGLDLLQAVDDHGREGARRGSGGGGLVGANPARDVDRVEVLVDQRLCGSGRLGVAEVGQLEARVGGVERARDVGVGLAVAHEEESQRGVSQLLNGEVFDDASSRASSRLTVSSASAMSSPMWLTSVPRSRGTRVCTSRSS